MATESNADKPSTQSDSTKLALPTRSSTSQASTLTTSKYNYKDADTAYEAYQKLKQSAWNEVECPAAGEDMAAFNQLRTVMTRRLQEIPWWYRETVARLIWYAKPERFPGSGKQNDDSSENDRSGRHRRRTSKDGPVSLLAVKQSTITMRSHNTNQYVNGRKNSIRSRLKDGRGKTRLAEDKKLSGSPKGKSWPRSNIRHQSMVPEVSSDTRAPSGSAFEFSAGQINSVRDLQKQFDRSLSLSEGTNGSSKASATAQTCDLSAGSTAANTTSAAVIRQSPINLKTRLAA